MFNKFTDFFSPPDQEEISAYQHKIPTSITVGITKDGDYYIARVEKINDETLKDSTFIAESKDRDQLVEEVNNMLLTYLDFPNRIKAKMPKLLPPAEFYKNARNSKELVFAK